MKDNDIYNYISKAEIFIYRLRSLYKNTSRQVIKSSEYKAIRRSEVLNLSAPTAKWVGDIG